MDDVKDYKDTTTYSRKLAELYVTVNLDYFTSKNKSLIIPNKYISEILSDHASKDAIERFKFSKKSVIESFNKRIALNPTKFSGYISSIRRYLRSQDENMPQDNANMRISFFSCQTSQNDPECYIYQGETFAVRQRILKIAAIPILLEKECQNYQAAKRQKTESSSDDININTTIAQPSILQEHLTQSVDIVDEEGHGMLTNQNVDIDTERSISPKGHKYSGVSSQESSVLSFLEKIGPVMNILKENIQIVDDGVVMDPEPELVMDTAVKPVDVNAVCASVSISVPIPIRGIENTFRNCYVNATFQCLSAIPGILEMLKITDDGTFEDGMRKQFLEFMTNNTDDMFKVKELKDLLFQNDNHRFKYFRGGGHHCILEFLDEFLCLFDNAINTKRTIMKEYASWSHCYHQTDPTFEKNYSVIIKNEHNKIHNLETQVNKSYNHLEIIDCYTCGFPGCSVNQGVVCKIII